jgi:hypothetical protein
MKPLHASLAAAFLASGLALGAQVVEYAGTAAGWWDANDGQPFPRSVSASNANGTLTTLNAAGMTDTRGHPFFTALGSNGRACVTCHQPSDGMALSVNTIRKRWEQAGPNDPLFATNDGADCPDLPRADKASHSLLLERGLFRIPLPWPRRDEQGRALASDFTIEVVRDPTGCNRSARYGLASSDAHISVYRRPRPATNMKYILAVGFAFDPKSGLPLRSDPQGNMVSEALMADSRNLTLEAQAREALRSHLQMHGDPSPDQIRQLIAFESGLSTAQSHDEWGGPLPGPEALEKAPGGVLQSTSSPIFKEFAALAPLPDSTPEQRAFRESVARGAQLFSKRQFLVKDTAGINTMGFGNPVRNSCAMCHNMHGSGIDVAPGRIDIGNVNEPFAKGSPELPLFKLVCKPGAKPHPYLGRVVYTQDPGYAMSTGRCEDIGKVMTQQMRGLSGRAPYFSNGSATDLRELVEIYNRRYNIGFSKEEMADLVNLMKVL